VYEKKPRTTVDLKQNIREEVFFYCIPKLAIRETFITERSGSSFFQHAATSEAELPEMLGRMC